MRDDDRRPVAHHLAQPLLDLGLGRRVDRRRGVVEDEHARVDDERPRDRNPLALTARERDPALADHRVVPVGQAVDELLRLRELGRSFDRLVRSVDDSEGDVLAHGCREEERVLRDDADRPPERAERHVAHVDAVELDAARARVVEAADQCRERRLAGTRVSDQRGRRARLELEVDAVQDDAARHVLEAHVAVVDAARPRRQLDRARAGPRPRPARR